MIVPNHEVPFVSATLGLPAGAWTDAKPGTCSMALDMITKGTRHHNEEQLSDELGTYAINLAGTAGMDSCRVSASCVTDQLERAMQLLGEVVREPTFPADDFETTRKQTLTGLKVSSREPAYVARREASPQGLWPASLRSHLDWRGEGCASARNRGSARLVAKIRPPRYCLFDPGWRYR